MNTSIIVIGLTIILIGLFIPIIYLGLVLLFAIVLIIVGLCMESEEQKIRRKRKICRICGKRITKEQAEGLGLCQACFNTSFTVSPSNPAKPCHPHGLPNCPFCYPKKPKRKDGLKAEFEIEGKRSS